MPNKLHSFKNKKCRKNLFSTPKVESQANNQEEVIEILTDDEIIALKDKLVKKLNKHAEANGINKLFATNHIVSEIGTYISQSRSALNKITYKCSVQCVSCDIRKPCTHVGHWQTSNLERHLKEHSKSTKTPTQTSNKDRQTAEILNELDEVLRSEGESDQ